MRTYKVNFIGFLMLLLFVQCGGSKQVSYELQNKPPFKILKAEYKNWIGGVEGVRGTRIDVIIDSQDVAIDTLYFRNQRIIPETKKLENLELQILGNLTIKSKPDLILHKKTQQEFGNNPPIRDDSFPFQLLKNEIILMYSKNETFYYVKIELLKIDSVFYK